MTLLFVINCMRYSMTRSKKHVVYKKIKPKSKASASIYEAAKDLYEIGLMDAITMRQFEVSCTAEDVHELSPAEIKKIRLKTRASQPVFAWYLNVKPTTVKKWETGENSPSGPALRLLNVIEQKGLDFLS